MSLKEDYLTIFQTSKFLGVTRQTVSRWIKEGKLPIEKIGRQMFIKIEDVLEYQSNILGELIINTIKYYGTFFIKKWCGYGDEDIVRFNKIVDENVYQFTVVKKDKSIDIINFPFDMSIVYKNKKYSLKLLVPSNIKALIMPANKTVKRTRKKFIRGEKGKD